MWYCMLCEVTDSPSQSKEHKHGRIIDITLGELELFEPELLSKIGSYYRRTFGTK